MMTTFFSAVEEELQNIEAFDLTGNPLEGGKNYKLRLPLNILPGEFGSVNVYENQTCLNIHTDQIWPSVFCSYKKLVVNKDDSVEFWFEPDASSGKKNNWIKATPGKFWKHYPASIFSFEIMSY
jgi:hypothetical protein